MHSLRSVHLKMTLTDRPLLLGDDLNATVQFNCTLNTMATVKKMGILWIH